MVKSCTNVGFSNVVVNIVEVAVHVHPVHVVTEGNRSYVPLVPPRRRTRAAKQAQAAAGARHPRRLRGRSPAAYAGRPPERSEAEWRRRARPPTRDTRGSRGDAGSGEQARTRERRSRRHNTPAIERRRRRAGRSIAAARAERLK